MTWGFLESGPVATASLALNWLVQSSVLLTVGLLAGRSLRRAGAAAQSTVYRTTLVATLLCPLASVLLASLGLVGFVIRLPVAPTSQSVAHTIGGTTVHAPAVERASVARSRSVSPSERESAVVPVVVRGGAAPRAVATSPKEGATAPAGPPSTLPWTGAIAGGTWIGLGIWLSGAAMLAMRLVLAQRALTRLRSSSVPGEAVAVALCHELAQAIRLDAPTVLRSPFLCSPCLAGVMRPAILLPEDGGAGLRETFVHELAHLARRDPTWNLLRRSTTALLWLQPLLWALSRRLELTAEEVCDDVVVHHGADRSRYAGHLLDFAERMLPPLALTSVGIVASRSSLGRRVGRILDDSRPLSTQSGIWGLTATALVGLAGTFMAALVSFESSSPAAAGASARPLVATDDPVPGEAISFAGRVVDKDTGKPVAGATIVVTRSVSGVGGEQAPPWAGDTTLWTNDDGRFAINFPPEQVAERGLSVALSRIEHADYVPLKGYSAPLANLLRGRPLGDPPFFATVTLERGQDFAAQVVTPNGQPAAGVPYEFENWAWSNIQPYFGDDTTGRTDAEGQIRLRMPKTQALAIRVMPEEYAPFLKFWGTDDPSKDPDVFAPTDLGRLVLEPGPILSGRLRDFDGRPISGQRVVARGIRNRHLREATTAPDGSFRFAPLRPGNYDVFAWGQGHGPYIDPTARPMPDSAPVVGPVRVYFRAGEQPEAVELRELPSVRVGIRFVDSQGHPARGSLVSLSGTIPPGGGIEAPWAAEKYPASALNEAEPEDQDKRRLWGCQLTPDTEGRVVFRAPSGLADAALLTYPPDETIAYKTQLEPDGPLKHWGGGELGNLDSDRAGIEIVVYRAPTVFAAVATEEGEPVPEDAGFRAGFDVQGGGHSGGSVRQADGRFRSSSLMPDHAYEFSAYAPGYVPKLVEHMSLPEGATAELKLVMRRKPKPPAVGEPAPPFSVKTLDGQEWKLADFRGRFVLIHFWNPYFGWDRDTPRIEAISKRFGTERLALLGLALSADVEAARQVVADRRLTWPQAVLSDKGADPVVQENGGLWVPKSILIGPDGKVQARDLSGDEVEKAVTEALRGR